MRWLKKPVFEIPVLAWFFSLAVAAAIPFLMFHLIVTPFWAVTAIAVLFFIGWLVRRHFSDKPKDEDDTPEPWFSGTVNLIAIYAYIWIFADQGFWAFVLYGALTLHIAIQIAQTFRIYVPPPEHGPSDKPWFN